MKKCLLFLLFVASTFLMNAQDGEMYRPKYHFTPAANWMNDPNGLYYNNGTYNLFFQYYPNDTKWGPMHWGHATSSDLISWQQQPIALYPDSLGYIFSGSVVVDKNNTSGLGSNGRTPVVAIFTHHDPKGEPEKRNNYQYQSIAYSLDDGKSWTKYANNPVLPNPGITDFRDPKVSWNEVAKKWIMALATKDRISFYSSSNLLQWTKQSEFGEKIGGHGGVWECPDLFPLKLNGKTHWVLLVSINPGGPNGGSATQYFVGSWNGKSFTPYDTVTRWIDYGPDNYAGVTYGNIKDRRVFMGWMSNWLYGQQVPTVAWRSAMTIPRELSLVQSRKGILLSSKAAKEVKALETIKPATRNLYVKTQKEFAFYIPESKRLFKVDINAPRKDFAIVLNNEQKEELVIGYDRNNNQYYLDRSTVGNLDLEGFSRVAVAPARNFTENISLTIYVDEASVELFADNGTTNMTGIFFFKTPFSKMFLRGNGITFNSITYSEIQEAAFKR